MGCRWVWVCHCDYECDCLDFFNFQIRFLLTEIERHLQPRGTFPTPRLYIPNNVCCGRRPRLQTHFLVYIEPGNVSVGCKCRSTPPSRKLTVLSA